MASMQVTGTEPASRRKAAQKQGGIKVTKMIRKPREPIKVLSMLYTYVERLLKVPLANRSSYTALV